MKSYTVVARTKNIVKSGLNVGGRRKSFNGKSALQVYDRGEAEEIRKKYKSDVTVTQDERHEWHLKNDRQTDGYNTAVHHYTFGHSRHFSAAWDAFEERRKKRRHAVQK